MNTKLVWPPMIAAALVLAGATPAALARTAASSHSHPASALAWQACPADTATPRTRAARQATPANLACATLRVPIDRTQPAAGTVALTVARLSAADPGKRTGVLMVNPGGPGESGVDEVAHAQELFSPQIRDRFDIVSFDPRGTNRSAAIHCDPTVERRTAVTRQRQLDTFTAQSRDAVNKCRASMGPLLFHVDTRAVADDMDAVRQALGEQRISYHGVSYGTVLGQQYAQAYPQRVRAMVLDSVVDHTDDWPRRVQDQVTAQEDLFHAFATWCQHDPKSKLKGHDCVRLYDELVAQADKSPVPAPGAPSKKTVNGDDAVVFTFAVLTGQDRWPDVTEALAAASEGDASIIRTALDNDDDTGTATGSGDDPHQAVLCGDWPMGRTTYRDITAFERHLRHLAPRYETRLGGQVRLGAPTPSEFTQCLGWPQPANPPQRITGALPQVMFINHRYDLHTPYPGALRVRKQFPGSAMVTYNAVGHVAYGSNACVTGAADSYLTTGRLPARDLSCDK